MLPATSTESVVTIVGIRFRPAGRIYYFDPQGQAYTTGQYAIVETVRGTEAGRVVMAAKKLAESDLTDPLKPVLRLASEDELRMMLSFKSKEKDALVQCARHVAQHNLPMKLVEAEYTFDGSRLTFYFTANERVDFRALVRDLAATFRTRIELRQIGARDQAKLQGGVGMCGKTLCCLSYENDNYVQAKQVMPQVGTMLNTPSGPGKVVSLNVPKEYVEVMLESGVTIQVHVNQEVEQKLTGNGGCGSCKANKANGGKCGSGCGGGGSCGCGNGGCATKGGGCGSCGVKRITSQN